ncbi:MAG: alginate export family protein [Candidatus Ratteibacteria bacterium]
MKGKLLKILIAAFAVCLISPAFSAVENVKVGGDISIYGVLRGDFDIGAGNENIHFFQTSARVYVEASLSNNVTGVVRLINERNWGYADTEPPYTGRDIDLDLAYIKVTDLLTPGLTLTVGRQEIQIGEGLVVGSQYNAYNYPVSLVSLAAPDLGLQKAFDAIKIDYSASAVPLNVSAFLSKINEGLYDDNDEATLYGLDIGYKVADVADLNVYYVRSAIDKPTDVTLDTAGLRVVSKIPAVQNFNLKGEYAKQFGDNGSGGDFKGWALLLGGEYKFATNMEPAIKVNYNLYTGQKAGVDTKEWVQVFPSNIGSRIGPLFYAYDAYNFPNDAETNLSVINVGLSLKPVEKLSLSLDGYLLKLREDLGNGKDVGTEIDLGIEYKYSEDLTFGLNLGKILADDAIENVGGDDAWQAIASMKLVF